jgi:CDP-4-dehydro-6-deoxyglucose reductase, E3
VRATINGFEFAIENDEALIEAGRKAGLNMPYSCLRGTCGTCRADLVSGEVDMPPVSDICLTTADVAGGAILMCVCKPKSDVSIVCDAVRPMEAGDGPRAFSIKRLDQLTSDVMIVTLTADDGLPVRYVPGQFMNVQTQDHGSRSYSLARPSAANGQIEFHIRHTVDGAFTTWLFEKAQLDYKLIIEQPTGRFSCDPETKMPRIFVASGTGFAPIRAILENLFKLKDSQPKWLYWGGRRPHDLYMDKLARNWTKLYPSFRYIPVVSDALAEDEWLGREGFVHKAALADHPDMSAVQVYACGVPVMVDACRKDFVEQAGLDLKNFHADSFV